MIEAVTPMSNQLFQGPVRAGTDQLELISEYGQYVLSWFTDNIAVVQEYCQFEVINEFELLLSGTFEENQITVNCFFDKLIQLNC